MVKHLPKVRLLKVRFRMKARVKMNLAVAAVQQIKP